MENHLFDPFFENRRTSSPRARSFPRVVPVTPSPRRYTGNSPPVNYDRENRTPSKVVSIPVRSIGLEKKRSSASLKIQKVFRGFLIRKTVKKIVGIKREVDEIERKLSEKDTIELIYSNTKERLKMNEMLMRLLLRLDSIRGVDSGVRDARKSVTRKTIMLQDRFDKIAAGDLMHEAGDQVLGDTKEGAECEDSNDASEDMEVCESVVDQLVEQVRETPEKGNAGNSMAESPEKGNAGNSMTESPENGNAGNSMTESPEKGNAGFRQKVDEENLESIEEGWEEIPGNEEINETVMDRFRNGRRW